MGATELYEQVDGFVSKTVFDTIQRFRGGEVLTQSEITKGLPCVDSPTPVVLGVSSYLIFVILGLTLIKTLDLKPRTKEPAVLKLFVIFHNFVCFALSLYMCVGIVIEAISHRYSFWGNAYNSKQIKMGHLLYIFYMSKYIEFMDTVIMILKRNTRQISLLHVYHHASIAIIWWIISYHAPGGEAYFSAALNSGVHVFMYLYYLLAATVGKNEKVRRKYLWWGKYLTQIQMFQFVLNMIQAYTDLKFLESWKYPRFLFKILFYYMISLLGLFGNFYVQKYVAPGPKQAGKIKSDKAE
ncbi:hypothetical protein R1sor_005456 [Riccia sorocarpa]|uniref:Very-long-chain 3-oxoacyl-CoA synthase n=1 Tax=Riccia sorocarpa TaxID=122646 RepID=A0ABD3HNZ8_9MARC